MSKLTEDQINRNIRLYESACDFTRETQKSFLDMLIEKENQFRKSIDEQLEWISEQETIDIDFLNEVRDGILKDIKNLD